MPYAASVSELRPVAVGPVPERWAAIAALGDHSDPAALDVLRELAAAPDWTVRRAAVEALGSHGAGRAAANLILRLLSDSSPYVIRSACAAAARLSLSEAHDSLARLLEAPDPVTRTAALRALPELWEPSDFERLLWIYTEDPSEEVRREAAWVLHERADEQNWRVLVRLWHRDALPRHRTWAARLVGRFGSVADQDILTSLRTDPDGHVRKAADRALENIPASDLA